MPPTRALRRLLPAAATVWLLSATMISGQLMVSPSVMRAHPNIDYAAGPTTDVVSRLNEQVKAGAVTLTAEPTTGYLRSVLQALDVPIQSQILVFSKTSFQAPRISPANPRAIYFSSPSGPRSG